VYSLIWIFAAAGRYRSVVRVGLGIAVIYASWMYLPALRTYSHLVGESARQSHTAARQLPPVHSTPPVLLPLNAPQQLSPPRNAAQARISQAANPAQQPKLSAAGLEIALQREPQFRPGSQLHCKAATRGWDYTCSYLPTPQLSSTRLQFGARVDAARWIELSRVVPAGTIIPSPQKRAPGNTRP
jgi:hypothetical protein